MRAASCPFLPCFQMCSFPRKPHFSLSPLIAPFLPAPGLGRFPKSLRIGFQHWRPGWAGGEGSVCSKWLVTWRSEMLLFCLMSFPGGLRSPTPAHPPTWAGFNSEVRKRLGNWVLLLFSYPAWRWRPEVASGSPAAVPQPSSPFQTKCGDSHNIPFQTELCQIHTRESSPYGISPCVQKLLRGSEKS